MKLTLLISTSFLHPERFVEVRFVSMAQHPFHIFECLRALNSIVFSPVRDYSAYDKLLHLNTLIFGKHVNYFSKNEWPCWLEVNRPEFGGFPVVPVELAEWICDWGGQTPDNPPKVKKYYRDASEFWQENQIGLNLPANPGITGERFDEQQERVLLWVSWLNEVWQPWAKDNLESFAAIEAYESFLTLFNQLQSNQSRYELVVANAVLLWRFDSTEIRHPLLTQKMELEYSPEQGSFRLIAKNTPARLEYDILYDVAGIDLEKLFALEQQLYEQPVDLRDADFLEIFSENFAQVIGYGCTVSGKAIDLATSPTSQPCIYYNQPVLFLRRQDGRKWRGELESITETIAAGASLPEMFNSYYADTQQGEEISGRNWKDNLAQPFFPWEGENVHKDILRRLAAQPLTVVQAPPKSSQDSLIANLLVHLLAHGKRVLVTGNSQDSLKAVSSLLYKDMPELASLCVSATGTDRENTRELLSSLRAHSQKMSYNSKEEIARELAQLQNKLGLFQKERAEDKLQVQSSRELEFSRRFNIEGRDCPAWQVAKWLADKQTELAYIADEIGHDKDCPLNKTEMARFFDLLSKVSPAEVDNLMLWLPKPGALLDAKELEELFARHVEFVAGTDDRKALLEDCLILDELDSAAIKEIFLEYQQALAELPGMEGGWLSVVLHDIVTVPQKHKTWQEIHQSIDGSIQKIQNLLSALSEYAIVLPESFDYRSIRDALYKVRVELYKNNKLGIFFKLSAGQKVLNIYNMSTIDGLQAQSVKEVDLLLARVDYLDELRKMTAKWNTAVADIEGPRVEAFETGAVDNVERYCAQIKRVLVWRKKYLPLLHASWTKFSRQQEPEWADRNWLAAMLPRIQAWLGEKRQEELTAKLMVQYNVLFKSAQDKEVHPICYSFKQAMDNRDSKLWQKCQQQLIELEEKKRVWQELDTLYKRLAEIAPIWTEQTVEQSREGFAAQPQDVFLAWRYKQAKAWLKKHCEGNRIKEITRRYYQNKAQENGIICEIAAKSAWYWQLKRVTAEEKRALDFLLSKNDLQYTDNFREASAYEFLREADFWRLSLPAWIMPVDILLETASTFDKLFDVVIVVDSEKCDIFSSSLLLRGKKSLIIGDKQLPATPGSVQGRAAANLLLEKSLLGLPEKIKFDLHDSLYSFALRLNESHNALLSERMLEPETINRFVDKHFYEDKLCLVPNGRELSLLAPALVHNFVQEKNLTGNSNEQEALQLVNKLRELIQLPEYSEKTFAVLTLGASEQLDILERLLAAKIDEESFAGLRLVCSSLDGYQGGSRDVVLLSLVSAKTAQLADEKKANAVLNLASEQLHIFVPFAQEDIAPYSIFSSLLAVACSGDQQTVPADSFAENAAVSGVVGDVYQSLKEKGYSVSAESLCGSLPLRLDIVVNGKNGGKAAIILDGLKNKKDLDEMFNEEQALHRQGWTICHLRACDFYIDKDAALAGLCSLLDKL